MAVAGAQHGLAGMRFHFEEAFAIGAEPSSALVRNASEHRWFFFVFEVFPVRRHILIV
jgi:hypothetical protein